MLTYPNCVILASVVFYLISKIVSVIFESFRMYKRGTLTSIPEIEVEEDLGKKWVPKKKHEVLKAKYKCLKKLFQIYDASVIGILPEPTPEPVEETKVNRRRKRSHRTKTDACAGTNEIASGDNTNSEYDNDDSSVGTAIIRDLNIDQSCMSTQMDTKIDKFAETVTTTFSEKNFDTCTCHLLEKHCQKCDYCQKFDHCQNFDQCQKFDQCQNFDRCQKLDQLNCQLQEKLFRERLRSSPQGPYERRKLTRFQCFVQRLFGIRREAYKPEGELYAASDPILTYKEKCRRRGLRFRRLRRSKRVKSETALRDMKNPSILSYVQTVQRNCLMDTTPRKCPIVGCNMVSYGIINYNDHLNLCHFKDRKYICHYCHEGFETEYDKNVHENEHIGISKLGANGSNLSAGAYKIASNTQTDPEVKIPDEKLKKIVSFFDKINDPEQILTEIKKNRFSETNLTSKIDTGSSSGSASERSERSETDKSHTTSCCNLRRKTDSNLPSSECSDVTSHRYSMHAPFCCRYCGETFTCKRQLSLHVNSEHRVRYTKFHSCAGIVRPTVDMLTEDGSINIQSAGHSESCGASLKRVDTSSTLTQDVASRESQVSEGKSEESLTCDPSTNIVYYTSAESLRKPSVVDSLVSKVRSYRWEPGTKIIRV